MPISPHRRSVTEEDLAPLPAPAREYLRRMGVVGRPRDRVLEARFRGRIRMRPGQPWMRYRARQRNTADPVTRHVRMRIDVAGVVPMFGMDSYDDHAGRMKGKLLGLVTVADGEGRELDLSELVTYVNDALMLAPSMLLTPSCEWSEVDAHSFDLAFTDVPNTVHARVVVDDDGRMVEMGTDDRWYSGTDPPTHARWTTPVEGWTTRPDGRPVPTYGSAVWHLPAGEFPYVRGAFVPSSVVTDPDGPAPS